MLLKDLHVQTANIVQAPLLETILNPKQIQLPQNIDGIGSTWNIVPTRKEISG